MSYFYERAAEVFGRNLLAPTFGADFHRMARIPRLQSEDLVIHSTGPFTPEEVDAISRLVRPGWLPDVCCNTAHTFSRDADLPRDH